MTVGHDKQYAYSVLISAVDAFAREDICRRRRLIEKPQ